jgi:hypothetical protein
MKTNHITHPTLVLAAWLTASLSTNTAAASFTTSYPLLPDLPGADISGETRIVIHLDQDTPLVELDGQLYALDGRPLEVAFAGLDHITLLFVLPRDTGVFVTGDGLWTQEIDPSATSTSLAFDLFTTEELGFEIAFPGQPAPVIPDVVVRPTEDDPDPI